MPKVLSRKTSQVEARSYEIYDGDDPTPGNYRGVLNRVYVQMSSGGNLMFKVSVTFKAKSGSDKAKYDGYTQFGQIVLGEHEALIEREQNFYRAIGSSLDPAIKGDGDFDKLKVGDGQRVEITTIGGKKPQGTEVMVRVRKGTGDFADRLDLDGIFPARDSGSAPAQADSIEDDEAEDADETVIGTEDYTEIELKGKSLTALRKIFKEEFEGDTAGLKKDGLIEAILEAQADEDEEEPEDEDEESEETAPEAEEEEEDEDEEEDEEDDEEEEDASDALREELKPLSRTELKVRLKKTKGGAEFKVLKSTTDDDLRDKIVEFEMVPF